MKIGLYSPYVPKHFGGGEKHFLTSAWYLAQKHQVEVLIPPGVKDLKQRIAKYEKLFALDLSKVTFTPSPLATGQRQPWKAWQLTHRFDAFLYLTDGSLFLSGAKRNILHIQIPFTQADGLLFPWKLKNWQIKNANSEFTRQVVEKAWHTTIPYLHYPYTTIPEAAVIDTPRQPVILAVGRFMDPQNNVMHSKHQDVLLEAFREGREQHGWDDWKLVLVGSIEPDTAHQAYVKQLKHEYRDLPVEWRHDIPDAELKQLYQSSSLFWHAAGFGVDEHQNPQQVEHFGMSTVEAMSYGLIPIVINKGGLKEIITDQHNGFFFSSPEELITATQKVITMAEGAEAELRHLASQRAQNFSLDRFCQTLDEMIGVA